MTPAPSAAGERRARLGRMGAVAAACLAVAVAACQRGSKSPSPSPRAPPGGTGGSGAPAAPADAGGGNGDSGRPTSPDGGTAEMRSAGACTPGEQAPCVCPGSAGAMPGTKICLAPDGTYTQCGCAFDWPYTGPTCAGGRVHCAPLPGQENQYAAKHCCTADQKCGLINTEAFGPTCYQRGAEPPGVPTKDCGETVIPFIETEDCCRPDGSCGLWYQMAENWSDLGCVERTELAVMLKNSKTLATFLPLSSNPNILSQIQAKPCLYRE